MASFKDAAAAFADRKPHKGASALRSDGSRLYSYAMLIAEHRPDGRTWVTSERRSVTTSKHVNAARAALARAGAVLAE